MEAGKKDKEEGQENDLIERVVNDPDFKINMDEMDAILKPESFTGRSEQQGEEFVRDCVKPVLDKNADLLGEKAELSV